MKSCIISIFAGIAIGFVGAKALERPAPAAPEAPPAAAAVPVAAPLPVQPAAPVEARPVWPLAGDDLRQWCGSLRQSGCPEPLVRALIITEANRRFFEDVHNPGQRMSLASLKLQRTALLSDLLGVEGLNDDARFASPYLEIHAELAFLSPEQQARAQVILKACEEKEREIAARARGFQTAGDRIAIEQARSESDQKLQEILSPSEFREFTLRRFASSPEIREKYENLQASAKEMEAIFDYTNNTRSETTEQEKETARNELKVAIGDGRYAQFMAFQTPEYREVVALARRFDLPEDVPMRMGKLQQASLRKYIDLNKLDFNQDPHGTMEAMRVVRSSTRSVVNSLLGEEAAAAFVADGKSSSWLR